MYVFALKLGLLPVIATRDWKGILMPALVLALTLGCLVYPAGKSYCFKRNVKRIY